MLVEHEGRRPRVAVSAYVAPTAVVSGDVRIGEGCRVLFGAVLTPEVFVATGVSVFPGARVGSRSEIRINGVVHVNSSLPDGALVPIGWIAVGDPAELFPPGEHERIWAIQRELDFPGTVYGVPREKEGETILPEVTRRYEELFGRHRGDRILT